MKRFTAFLLGSLFMIGAASCSRTYPAKTKEDIMDLLAANGVSASEDCSEKTVTIPSEFGEVYENYNDLQKKQGFDLSRYRSREATVYTFPVISVDGAHTDFTEAHVMVCDDIVIGADISSPALDGGMSALIGDHRSDAGPNPPHNVV